MEDREFVDLLVSTGFQRDDDFVRHPECPELALWYKPEIGSLLFSPDLVAFVKQHQQWMIYVIGFLKEVGTQETVH